MSHWAEIDSEGNVLRVLVGNNDDPNGDEGYCWLIDNLGGEWIKTSYNASVNGFRKHFAGIGFKYDKELDAFIPPKPTCHESVIFNAEECKWICPENHEQTL